MQVFRIKINPGGTASQDDTFQYCLDNKLLGVGWRIQPPNQLRSTKNWDVYATKVKEEMGYDEKALKKVKRIKERVRKNDLVWTRGVGRYAGKYYLARVKEEWEYWNPPEASERDIDIANIVRCDDIIEIPLDSVLGKVAASFGGHGHVIQRVVGETVREYSKYLWNKVSGQNDYKIDVSNFPGLLDMLSYEEAEDVLFLYLQAHGWYVIPNSRKGNTMKYEFLLTNPQSGGKAKTQVKVGHSPINTPEFRDDQKVFLFQTNGHYEGEKPQNVECVTPEAMLGFIKENMKWLPGWLQNKADMIKLVRGDAV